MNVEEAMQNLIAQNRAQAKEIESLKNEIGSLKALAQHYKLSIDDIPHQYTWDEANKQFRVDL